MQYNDYERLSETWPIRPNRDNRSPVGRGDGDKLHAAYLHSRVADMHTRYKKPP